MDIKAALEKCGVNRIRSVAKADAVYDAEKEARDAESAASNAKDAKEFDKQKKSSLTAVDQGDKAAKAWQTEIDNWDGSIKDVEAAIATEKTNIAQQQKEADAVKKAIDDINAQIKEYNDSLILKERDPRARPYFAQRDTGAKLTAAAAALAEATKLVETERTTWKNQQEWTGKPIKELKAIKDRMSKAKFTKPK